MAESLPAAAQSRQIRVFLSSTFRDFMQERDLLVKEVFPELRRKARERGVDVVDVDLRWGITEEESNQGKTIGICLDEIERCRPYFIGLLGDRYGWVPEHGDYGPELLWRQNWLAPHQGNVSVTELEILHGVLNDKEMAGRAFFYFRDPSYSDAKAAEAPGWRSESSEERQKLEALKERIRHSGFPVVEKGLGIPQAIADRIETDLWSLIDEQFPEAPKNDALAVETARHASYRANRTGLYLGGEAYIQQLQRWISAGEQRILISGDSGAGKSALIANWVAAHKRSHPDDVIFCHHLGCSNDASALRPLLARMIDSASRLLVEQQLISEPLKVPQDWWELVSKVSNTLSQLRVWANRHQCRWIWVLDGLDKLDLGDQQALPWLPLDLPKGVHLVASSLDCQVRTLLQERQFTELTIGPLGGGEQEQLIKKYLKLYTKELVPSFRQQITSHPQAKSPLFLRVLLEELRLCGRFETLAEQLQGYLTAESVADLYELVLQRLEDDGHGDAVQKVMTALWASRAGLSENELLAITGLVHAQWAPIGIGLQEALSEASGRLVFDHNYLRKAVEDRYLQREEDRRHTHSDLADWCEQQDKLSERDAEEWPWQLMEAGRLEDLRDLLLIPWELAGLSKYRPTRELVDYWIKSRGENSADLDELIEDGVNQVIDDESGSADSLIWFVDRIADVLEEAGLYRELLLRLRVLSLKIVETSSERSEESKATRMNWLGNINREMGQFKEAERMYRDCLVIRERILGEEHLDTLDTINNLARTFQHQGEQDQAKAYFKRNLVTSMRIFGGDHPDTLTDMNNLGMLLTGKGDLEEAENLLMHCLRANTRLLGPEDPSTLLTMGNLGALLSEKGDFEQAETLLGKCLREQKRVRGAEHPDTLTTMHNLSLLYIYKGDFDKGFELAHRCFEISNSLLGPNHPDTATTMMILGDIYHKKGEITQAEAFYQSCLDVRERVLGPLHPDTNQITYKLADVFSEQECYIEAIFLRRRELSWSRQVNSDTDIETLTSILFLATELGIMAEFDEAEKLFRELVNSCMQDLHPDDAMLGHALHGLAKTLRLADKLQESIFFAQKALNHRLANEGLDTWDTNNERLNLARILNKLGRNTEAIKLLHELQASIGCNDEPDDDDRQLSSDAAELLRLIEGDQAEEA